MKTSNKLRYFVSANKCKIIQMSKKLNSDNKKLTSVPGIVHVVQLTDDEKKSLDAAFAKDANLHEIIGCGRTAIWRGRTGKNLSIENLNAIRKFLNQKQTA